ncbi:head-tail connector protein [Pacificibacter marinus]|uniref:head-tail connector protein n=1 Tax=Pacificibacter marinus TaxID=658057 RepID=UPI001C073015|nr:head-tail connector protein [Pacificibacter marinus]MBU2869030.1 head-tail connector protein [Pacificibacter marinus]
MMLMEQSQVPLAVLPVAQFKEHLRLGTGFGDDGVQDGVLETYLRAALAAVEARTDKVLIERDFAWTVSAWRDLGAQTLPVAPVSAITALVIVDRLGAETVIDVGKYLLDKDTHRPRIVSSSFVLPSVPVAGQARIEFTAGFGPAWGDLPADLAHAVMLLAAHFYEHRHETAVSAGAMPFGVSALLDRYRNVRLFGGRG